MSAPTSLTTKHHLYVASTTAGDAERVLLSMVEATQRQSHGYAPELRVSWRRLQGFEQALMRAAPHGGDDLSAMAPDLTADGVFDAKFSCTFAEGAKPPCAHDVLLEVLPGGRIHDLPSSHEAAEKRRQGRPRAELPSVWRMMRAWAAAPSLSARSRSLLLVASAFDMDAGLDTPSANSDAMLASYAARLAQANGAPAFERIALAVTDIERLLPQGVMRREGASLGERPLDLALDPGFMRQLLGAVMQSRPQLAAAVRAFEAHGRFLVFPVSPQGFLSDDAAANYDPISRGPRLTMAPKLETHGDAPPMAVNFEPKTLNAVDTPPEWLPYLTADPMIYLLSGLRGGFGFEPQEVLGGQG